MSLQVTQDLSVTTRNIVPSSPPSVKHMRDKWVQVFNVASGGQTVQLFGSIDGTNYKLLTGTGLSGLTNLPSNGSITSDDVYFVPHRLVGLFAKKTAGDDTTVVTITLTGEKREASGGMS